MNEETKKAIDDSIAHWKRMIACAGQRPKEMYPHVSRMYKEIKETWFSNFCSLCTLFYDFSYKNKCSDCDNCPLKLKGYRCESHSSPWSKVNMSLTWGEWTENAKEFLKILEGLKDD